jgi:hypothetical protein
MTQLAKINKKTSMGDFTRKDSRKLVIDHPAINEYQNLTKSMQTLNEEERTVQMIQSELFGG